MKTNLVVWGLGKHSINKVIPAITKSKKINLYGLYTRNKKILRKEAIKFINCKIWNNEKEMLLDNKIDAIYLSTPIGLHYESGKKILNAGKHLWCEKSLASDYKQVCNLIKIAKKNNLAICEAFMYLYHPIFKKIKSLVDKKYIGEIISFTSTFCCPHLKKSDWRYKNNMGGGALLDLGCYPISSYINLFKTNSKLYYARLQKNKLFNKVDTSGAVFFKNKKTWFNLNWGLGFNYQNNIHIIGTKGTITAEPFFSKPENLKPKIKIPRPGIEPGSGG